MQFQLDPLDTLFFRDGRPFTMGDDSFAEGIFPPLPSTVLGAFRSLWISQKIGSDERDLADLAEAARKIELRYFGLALGGGPIFPAPLDLFLKEKKAQPMCLLKNESLVSSCPPDVSHLFFAETKGKTDSITGHFFNQTEIDDYLSGKPKADFSTIDLRENALKREHKIGIGRSSETNRTEDGLLFRLLANRMEDGFGKNAALSILIKLHGFEEELASLSAIPLGGERKIVAAKKTDDFDLPKCPTLESPFFKLILLTPAPLGDWHLAAFAKKNGLKLIAASIGKPVLVGGWDYKKPGPKPMRRAVSAGSVFLFEAENPGKANEIAQKMHNESICAAPDDHEGFGLCFVARPFQNQLD